MSNLAIIPHNDDESLFLAFTLCREAADIQVVVIFDGYVQASRGEPVTWQRRREETVAALKELGVVKPPMFAGFRDNVPDWTKIKLILRHYLLSLGPPAVYYPKWEEYGHGQHNQLSQIVNTQCRDFRLRRYEYTTYTTKGKSIGTQPIVPEPDWIRRKLRALACYRSQIEVANCREHFMRGLHEYYA